MITCGLVLHFIMLHIETILMCLQTSEIFLSTQLAAVQQNNIISNTVDLHVYLIWMKCPLNSLKVVNKSSSLAELNSKEQREERPGIIPVQLISTFIRSPVWIKW